MESTEIGRLVSDEIGNEHSFDDPTKAYSALLTKMDEVIEAIKGITAKIDADSGDTGGDTDYAALWTDSIEKLKFRF